MHHPHGPVSAHPVLGLSHVSAEHARQRDLPIREESIQRLSIGHRFHLVRETLSWVWRDERHNPSQPLIQPCIAERLTVELRQDVSNLDSAWCAHASS
jgi:hypothetical protein